MASRPVLSVVSGQGGARPGQKSWSNALELPRGDARPRHRAQIDPVCLRADFGDRWALFCRRAFADRPACQRHFCVSFQTVCNWWDGGICRPSGHVVAMAALEFPALFCAVVGGGE
jgi:hypothetical protein